MWEGLGLNVIGGILAGLAFSLWHLLVRVLQKSRFKQIFGRRAVEERITLVYEEMASLNEADIFQYRKPEEEKSGHVFSVSRPIPIASVRGISYLSNTIGSEARQSPSLRSEAEIRALLDLDFISFGGPFSNTATETALTNSGNRLVNFDQTTHQFRRKSDGIPLVTF